MIQAMLVQLNEEMPELSHTVMCRNGHMLAYVEDLETGKVYSGEPIPFDADDIALEICLTAEAIKRQVDA